MTKDELVKEIERLQAEPRKVWHIDYVAPDDPEPIGVGELDAVLADARRGKWICPVRERKDEDWDSYYVISKNEIVMQPRKQYADDAWRSELLHNMAHSLAARDGAFDNGWQCGTADYARLELMAELFAARVMWNFHLRPVLKRDCEQWLHQWAAMLREWTVAEYRDMLKTIGMWECEVLRRVLTGGMHEEGIEEVI